MGQDNHCHFNVWFDDVSYVRERCEKVWFDITNTPSIFYIRSMLEGSYILLNIQLVIFLRLLKCSNQT